MLAAASAWPALRGRLSTQATYMFTPWGDIDERDRLDAGRLSLQPPCKLDPAMRPLQGDVVLEPAVSLAVRRAGRLVGWVLGERVAEPGSPPAIYYAAAYLDMALWRSGILVEAYRRALARQQAAFGADSIARFSTNAAMTGMIALIRRRIAPIALSVDEMLVTRKRIR
jgi:hypothetical protein